MALPYGLFEFTEMKSELEKIFEIATRKSVEKSSNYIRRIPF